MTTKTTIIIAFLGGIIGGVIFSTANALSNNTKEIDELRHELQSQVEWTEYWHNESFKYSDLPEYIIDATYKCAFSVGSDTIGECLDKKLNILKFK